MIMWGQSECGAVAGQLVNLDSMLRSKKKLHGLEILRNMNRGRVPVRLARIDACFPILLL